MDRWPLRCTECNEPARKEDLRWYVITDKDGCRRAICQRCIGDIANSCKEVIMYDIVHEGFRRPVAVMGIQKEQVQSLQRARLNWR
jgi:hypothetical protein